MSTYIKSFITINFVTCVFVVSGSIPTSTIIVEPLSETEKITELIEHIEQLQEAKFVRNGKEYDAKAAAEFLRSKWNSQKSKVKTAADFIELVASKSSRSGKPYLIRFKDGKEIKSGDYLRDQLKELEVK